MTILIVMAGLVPAIHVFGANSQQDVDARHKAGHDENVVIVFDLQQVFRTPRLQRGVVVSA
jgi:hypothetical protein